MKTVYLLTRVFLVTLFLFFSREKILANSFAWTPSSTITPTLLSSDNVTTCYDVLHNRIIAAWIDLNTNYPTYSIYENGLWSIPTPIDPSMTATGLRSVFLCYDTQNNQIFASWNDTNNTSFFPFYSIFNNGSWSSPAAISTAVPLVGTDVFVSYNPVNNQIIATWSSDVTIPTYSVFTSGSWTTPLAISAGGSAAFNIYSCFDSSLNLTIATWADLNNSSAPTFSFFNGASWTPASVLAVAANAENVFPCYNPSTNQIFATWIDLQNNNFPTFSIYNGISWTPPDVIGASYANGIALTLFTCFDSKHNQLFAGWPSAPCDPTYSIYSNGSWSSLSFINHEPPGVLQDLFFAYNPVEDEMFATWTDCITSLPYYSIYLSSSLILPPINFTGKKRANRFLTQTERVNQLNWQPPKSGAFPILYKIYRDNINNLIATIPSAVKPLEYIDHDISKKKAYTYYITSVDAENNQSSPATITIK